MGIKRMVGETLPDELYAPVATIHRFVNPNRNSLVFFPKGDNVWVWYPGSSNGGYVVPNRWSLSDLSPSNLASVYDSYTMDGFVDLEPSDTVVDVGAYIGTFSIPAATVANTVIAVEPDPVNYSCLTYNLRNISNVDPYQVLLNSSEGVVDFNLAPKNRANSSMLDVDTGDSTETISIDARRLDRLAQERGLDQIDYLKIDAEGAEPEVLEGCSDVDIRKLAVQCGPERYGEYTVDEVSSLLENRGYDVKHGKYKPTDDTEKMVYAKLP